MLLDLASLAGGAFVVAHAGSRLVDFAAAIAEKARLTPAVIGLTIVAAGTSTPELVVSLTAAWQGSPDIAIGNVVGWLLLGPPSLGPRSRGGCGSSRSILLARCREVKSPNRA
jgi:Ca2+/Na+ antiporter